MGSGAAEVRRWLAGSPQFLAGRARLWEACTRGALRRGGPASCRCPWRNTCRLCLHSADSKRQCRVVVYLAPGRRALAPAPQPAAPASRPARTSAACTGPPVGRVRYAPMAEHGFLRKSNRSVEQASPRSAVGAARRAGGRAGGRALLPPAQLQQPVLVQHSPELAGSGDVPDRCGRALPLWTALHCVQQLIS